MNQKPLSKTQPDISPEQSEHQFSTPTLTSTNWIKILLLAVSGLILIAGAVYADFYIGKEQVEVSQPTSKKLDVVEMQKQQDEDSDTFSNSTLLQHPDLQELLQNTEIQAVKKFTISPSNMDAWIIDAIDKSYLKGNQLPNDSPRHQYLVTSMYWKDMQGPLAVECLTSKVFPVIKYNQEKQQSETTNLLVKWSCSVAEYVSLFNLETGNKTPLSDPNNLVPSDNAWIVNDEGDSAGVMEPAVFSASPVFIVNYGHAEPFGAGIFSAETGRLLQLTLYNQDTK